MPRSLPRSTGRRRKAPEKRVNHDRWLVSYADFITLLFAFFVVMYSVSQVNESKYRTLSETLSGAFKARAGVAPVTAPDGVEPVDMEQLAEDVREVLNELVDARRVTVQATEEWVEISVNASLLFASGSAEPSAEARRVFGEVAALLGPLDNPVDVSGHTDDRPIDTAEFGNNWELSAARATSVVELLNAGGIAPQRLSATGYGEFRPVADNSTEAGRAANRRVALVVARRQAVRPQVASDALTEALAPEKSSTEPIHPAPARNQPAPDRPRGTLEPIIREDGSLLFTSDPDARGD